MIVCTFILSFQPPILLILHTSWNRILVQPISPVRISCCPNPCFSNGLAAGTQVETGAVSIDSLRWRANSTYLSACLVLLRGTVSWTRDEGDFTTVRCCSDVNFHFIIHCLHPFHSLRWMEPLLLKMHQEMHLCQAMAFYTLICQSKFVDYNPFSIRKQFRVKVWNLTE